MRFNVDEHLGRGVHEALETPELPQIVRNNWEGWRSRPCCSSLRRGVCPEREMTSAGESVLGRGWTSAGGSACHFGE